MPPRLTHERRYKNAKTRLFRVAKDWGWMFSQRLAERVCARTGLPRGEVERLMDVMGSEGRELLLQGHAVGLPHFPAIYCQRLKDRRIFFVGKWMTVSDYRMRVYTSQPFRKQMQERLLDRGDIRAQYDAERSRVTGFTDKGFRPRKKKVGVSKR